MKYKVGEKVVLKSGKEVKVELIEKGAFYVVGNKGDFFLSKITDSNIDHEKTAELSYKPDMKSILDSSGIITADTIEPPHYRKGDIDLYEAAYLTRPFNEYRAIMEFVAERYIKRDKENRAEDLEKAIYTLERLKEKEEEHARD